MAESFDLESVDWLTAGAIGSPGQRTFFIQVRDGDRYIALLVEKQQVQALADLAQELLASVDVVVTPDDLDEAGHRLVEPIQPAWRVGALSLGMAPDGERFLLEADELTEDEETEGASARFWLSRAQLVSLAAYAAFVVQAGARDSCRLCNRPIDPEHGHVCPSMNGHGPLTG